MRWLDLGTGTGAVALLAARAGAHVTGLDLAPRLIQTACRRARAEALHIRFDVGDAQALPYPDASFDAISSAMGIIFAPDHQAIARELARVCPPGGMIAFSAWREGGGWTPVTRRYFQAAAAGEQDPHDWGREHYVQATLGDAFGLRFEEGNAPLTGPSGQEIWQLAVSASGPFKGRVAALQQHRRECLRREFVEYLDGHRQNGLAHIPTPYLLTVGIRRR